VDERRRRRQVGTGALSLAVLAGGSAAWFSTDSHQVAHGGPKVAARSTRPAPLRIKLVDYVGQDPQGFTFGTIPQGYGFDLQASTPYTVVISPSGNAATNPDSFIGKLVVSAESASTFGALSSLGKQSVTVNGNPGRLGDDGTATQIWWQVGSIMIDVQCWDSVGLTHDQLVTFANSVSTTPQLQLSLG
jgi:hypothetical protein